MTFTIFKSGLKAENFFSHMKKPYFTFDLYERDKRSMTGRSLNRVDRTGADDFGPEPGFSKMLGSTRTRSHENVGKLGPNSPRNNRFVDSGARLIMTKFYFSIWWIFVFYLELILFDNWPQIFQIAKIVKMQFTKLPQS